jgi:hypothetical protein
MSYQEDYAKFNSTGGGRFLRGSIQRELGTEDVDRGRPYTLWLELKLRDGLLNGSLIAVSQRPNPTGPLTHWVELTRK